MYVTRCMYISRCLCSFLQRYIYVRYQLYVRFQVYVYVVKMCMYVSRCMCTQLKCVCTFFRCFSLVLITMPPSAASHFSPSRDRDDPAWKVRPLGSTMSLCLVFSILTLFFTSLSIVLGLSSASSSSSYSYSFRLCFFFPLLSISVFCFLPQCGHLSSAIYYIYCWLYVFFFFLVCMFF